MRMITSIREMKEFSRLARLDGKTIGFVPTMGYLHEGHLSLVRAAREECDAVVMSIFVNPIQFGLGEDLNAYPRDLERDRELADTEGVDVLFYPSEDDMYAPEFMTYVEVRGPLTEGLCGASRPGHFRGVATVVAKLLNIVAPDVSYFGQKDAQQAAVIKRMAEDLNMDTRVRVMPIVREADGLAMSSRNAYLSLQERKRAVVLYGSLKKAAEMVAAGESSTAAVKTAMRRMIEKADGARVDYIEIVDEETFEPVDTIAKKALVALAVFIGKTRLIDNMVVSGIEPGSR